jgi:hypothetical protein
MIDFQPRSFHARTSAVRSPWAAAMAETVSPRTTVWVAGRFFVATAVIGATGGAADAAGVTACAGASAWAALGAAETVRAIVPITASGVAGEVSMVVFLTKGLLRSNLRHAVTDGYTSQSK